MTHNNPAPPLSSAIWRLVAISWVSVKVRYRPSRPASLLHLGAAVFDVVIYATAVYLVVDIVFQRGSFERYALILIGFIAFTWTVRSMMEARNFVELRDRLAEASNRPVAAAVFASLAPPTFTFLLSLGGAVVLEVAVFGAQAPLSEAAWVAPTILIQLVWNVVLLLALGAALARRWIASVMPAAIAVIVVWMISPIMYRFEDVPTPANALLTSLNPASHLLAAYHNALWRGEPMSLKVLPAVGVLGIALIVWLAHRAAVPAQSRRTESRVDRRLEPHLVAVLDGPVPPFGPGRVFGRWRGELGGLTGEDAVALISAARGQHATGGTAAIGAASEIGRLFRDSMSIYPPWALAQLAFATAMASGETDLILDGLLDETRPAYLAQAWAHLEREAAAGRRITVVTYIALSLPWAAKGTFEVVGAGGHNRVGTIGPALDAAYSALRGASRG